MSHPFIQQIKKGKFKTFFFFLLLALIFWVLTKFSKEYTDTVRANLLYTDLPENVSIIGERSSEILFDMKSNGFEFLYFKIKKPSIEIDISSYYKEGNNSISLTSNDLITLLNDRLSNINSVNNVYGNGIVIQLDRIVSIKLPVEVQNEILFKEGYKAVGVILSEPDSITVSGPIEALNKIKNIKTDILKLEDVDRNISASLRLIKPTDVDITLKPDEVSVLLNVQEFSQKRLSVPIELIKIPKGQHVKIIPETINLTFDVLVDDFNTISESDFRIICDFSKRNKKENTMIPVIEMVPGNISNVELSIKKVEYLIFK